MSEPMSEEHLARIEAANELGDGAAPATVVAALVAEVRRLRAEGERLRKQRDTICDAVDAAKDVGHAPTMKAMALTMLAGVVRMADDE